MRTEDSNNFVQQKKKLLLYLFNILNRGHSTRHLNCRTNDDKINIIIYRNVITCSFYHFNYNTNLYREVDNSNSLPYLFLNNFHLNRNFLFISLHHIYDKK